MRSIIPMENQSTVIRADIRSEDDWQYGTVLATIYSDETPYVVWSVDRLDAQAGPFCARHGSYHKDLPSAETAFEQRVSLNA